MLTIIDLEDQPHIASDASAPLITTIMTKIVVLLPVVVFNNNTNIKLTTMMIKTTYS